MNQSPRPGDNNDEAAVGRSRSVVAIQGAVVDREEDVVVFGRCPTTAASSSPILSPILSPSTSSSTTTATTFSSMLADSMTKSIHEALQKGVESLPLLLPHHRQEVLLQRLKPEYYRNVDILEMYASNHVFSLNMVPLTRRQRIVQAYLQEQQQQQQQQHQNEGILTTTNTNVETARVENGEENDDSFTMTPFPNKDQIPTASQMETLSQETQSLRAKLKEQQLLRDELLMKCQALEQVHSKAKKLAQSLQSSQVSSQQAVVAVDQSVTAMIMGKQGLEQLRAKGIDLLKNELDRPPKQKSRAFGASAEDSDDNDDDDDHADAHDWNASSFIDHGGKENNNHSAVLVRKKQKMMMIIRPEQEYQHERSMLQVTPGGLETLRNIILRRSNNN